MSDDIEGYHLIPKIAKFIEKAIVEFTPYSFDELYETYEDLQGPSKLKASRRLVEDVVKGRSNDTTPPPDDDVVPCLCVALRHVFDNKNYDKKITKEIQEYGFRYYPDPKEEDFREVILSKREFGMNLVEGNTRSFESACQSGVFELSPHQVFLKQWMSPNTPYKGLLIYHGVGVGKTCSGVSIAENFKDIYGRRGGVKRGGDNDDEDIEDDGGEGVDKRIIVLASQNIQVGWKNTIVNPALGGAQCTGDAYPFHGAHSETKLKSFKTKVVKTYYDLMGYTSFANSVKRMLDKETGAEAERDCIRRNFSGRMLIIDEVHNIRSTDTQNTRNTIDMIMKVIKHSQNLRLVLLTANPMFNQPNEIIWILNMLLLNDNRPMIYESDIFHTDTDGIGGRSLTNEGVAYLKKKCQGYVSYVRGENPVSFPMRLYPETEVPDPGFHLVGKEGNTNGTLASRSFIDPFGYETNLTFLQLYSSYLEGEQLEVYDEILGECSDNTAFRIQDETKLLQVGNMVYPKVGEGPVPIHERYGEAGFDACFRSAKGPVYTYIGPPSEEGFLDIDYIGNYSQKMKQILMSIQQSQGIVFIYTNWIKGGLLPLLIALEYNGYKKYDKRSILNSKVKREPMSYDGYTAKDHPVPSSFQQGSYMVVSAVDGLTPKFEDELKVLTSEENKDGEKIKIVIGSTVAAEGLDFKNIRSIHILEPWHNLNKLEQVIGRGVRNCSHKMLDEQDRNVTIYLHNAMIQDTDGDRGTLDTHLYQYSEKKAMDIGKIEDILKQSALDRDLFREVNLLTKKVDVEPVSVKPAHRPAPKTQRRPIDTKFSRVCSFQEECDYLCGVKSPNKKPHQVSITMDLRYSQGFVRSYQRRISALFKECMVYSDEEIIHNLETYMPVETCILIEALTQMVNQRLALRNRSGHTGHLIRSVRGGTHRYYFQPSFSNDPTLPYYYRMHSGNQLYPDTTVKPRAVRSYNVSSDVVSLQGVDFDQSTVTCQDEINDFMLSPILSDLFTEKQRRVIGTQWAFDRIPPSHYQEKLAVLYHVFSFMNGVHYTEAETEVLESLSDYLHGSFYHEDEGGSFRVASEPLTVGSKTPTVFGAFHPGNKQVYYYRYIRAYDPVHGVGPDCLQKLGAVDMDRITKIRVRRASVQGFFRSQIDRTWGFVLYSTQSRHVKHPYNGFVCLMTMDNKGRGRILMDKDNRKELIPDIEAQCPEIWKDVRKQRIIKGYRKRYEYAWLLELHERSRSTIYPHELFWEPGYR